MTTMKELKKENTVHGFGDNSKEKNNICYGLKQINYALISCFYWFGYQVGLRPLYFIIVPFVLSAALASGLFFIKYEDDPGVLFIPFTAPFIREQRIVDEHFPTNYSHFYDPLRFTHFHGFSRIIVSAKDGGSILRSILWPEIIDMDAKVRNISIFDKNGKELKYADLCSKWNGKCMQNAALNINEIVGEIENGTTIINYPLMVVPFIIPQLLGGPVINESAGRVEDAKAILMGYFIANENEGNKEMVFEWESKQLDFLHNLDYKYIKVNYFLSRSLRDELKDKMDSCLPYIPLTGLIMVTACMVLLWMSDCVRGKPLIGVVGIISAIISTGAAFGFLIFCGAVYTRLNIVAFFLALGIGVDDIFVAISAWQKTTIKDPVPLRLAQTYADAAVSVTITSLTNALAFAVGTSTPTVIVESFCLYSCVTIIFAYVLFVTICGGFLALSGHMEEQGRHSLFLVKIKDTPQKASTITKKFYSIFCSSSSHGKNAKKKNELHTHVVSVFFRDYVGSWLCNSTFRVCALISFIGYLTGAIYGLTILREGLYRHRMTRDDSYLVDFAHTDNRYFRHLPYSIQAVITGNVTYSDPETQNKLTALRHKFESLPYGSEPLYTQSWLHSFLKRLRRRKDWQAEIKDEKSFIKVLREKYLNKPDNRLKLDVQYNKDYSRIMASRMIFQSANVKDVYDDVVMMNTYRKAAEESEFNVTCFHLLFSLFDQYSMMKPLAIQSILIAVALVMVVALLFIPDIRGSFAIAFSILSIATGVVGYMAYWDINLDHVSAGSIFMCIGFSVDFSAHITYTYLASKHKTSKGKIRDSMSSLGLPILQGAFTTVLSLVTFLLIPGYGYRTFFKTIFLVTIFAAYHSIILIPLFLAKLEDISATYKRKSKSKEIHENKSSVRPIANGSFKQMSNGHSKTRNIDLNIKNNNDNETVIGVVEGQYEEPSQKELSNGLSNGGTFKVEKNSKKIINIEGEDGIDNVAFTSDEDK